MLPRLYWLGDEGLDLRCELALGRRGRRERPRERRSCSRRAARTRAFWRASAALAVAFSSFLSRAWAAFSSSSRWSSFCFWTAVSWRSVFVWRAGRLDRLRGARAASRGPRRSAAASALSCSATSSWVAHLGEHVGERARPRGRSRASRSARPRRPRGSDRRARPCASPSSRFFAVSWASIRCELVVEVAELEDEILVGRLDHVDLVDHLRDSLRVAARSSVMPLSSSLV